MGITENFERYGLADRHYHFACSSDMGGLFMKENGLKPELVAIARLPGHKLSFHGWNPVWDGGLPTVVGSPGDDLWGVVYSFSFTEGLRLDVLHDARLDGAGKYFRYPTDVIDPTGAAHTVFLYKLDIQGPYSPPSREYVLTLVEGARERAIPKAYVDFLGRLECVPAAFPVPRRARPKRTYVASPRASCGVGDGG
jgi:hypothetical protein